MERRFTVKDFLLFLSMAVLAVLIVLAMYMVDRQWLKLEQMQRVMEEQADDLRSMRGIVRSLEQNLEKGQFVRSGSGALSAHDHSDTAFQRAKQAIQQPEYQSGDWRVLAFGTGLKTITPLVSSDAYASEVQGYVQESLILRDPETLEWKGLIAKSWQVSDDGLMITFQLHDNVKFSDGKPLTAEDVVFSFDFIMTDAIAAPRSRAYFEKIASVTAISQYEVVFQFKEPYFNSLSLAGGMSIMPKHFYAPYLKEPHTFNESKGLLMGSGPYRLSDPKGWTPDLGMVELERNPRYWGEVQPSFDKLLWKVIENDSARLTTFRNGDIDLYSARPREYQGLLDDEALSKRTQNLEYMSPTAGYSYIGWNQLRDGKATRFADKRVRQAMTWLTDQAQIIDDIMLGYAEAAVSPFSPRSPQHNQGLNPYGFDLSKAQALLFEAGYQDNNGDGVLENSQGEPFKFELVYFQDSEDTKRIVLFLKDLYARAGILVQPKPTEWSVMLDLLDKKDFDAITLGWTSGIEIDIYQMFHSSQIEEGDNYIHYKNEKLDQLIDQARSEVDEDKRMPLWQASERILYEDQPYTFLFRRKSMVFVDRRMKNVQVTPLGLNLHATPVEWYVPKLEQRYTR
ncbi:MAG TPA: ABC transporter substrate-binding protein [Gammaproteobacteria bacterium]|nr:ABC transporter substrate-binding protein [Gammaproteobacteria bacterium]